MDLKVWNLESGGFFGGDGLAGYLLVGEDSLYIERWDKFDGGNFAKSLTEMDASARAFVIKNQIGEMVSLATGWGSKKGIWISRDTDPNQRIHIVSGMLLLLLRDSFTDSLPAG